MSSLNKKSLDIICKILNIKDPKEAITKDFGTKRSSGKYGKERLKIYQRNFRGVRLCALRVCMPEEFYQKLQKKITLS